MQYKDFDNLKVGDQVLQGTHCSPRRPEYRKVNSTTKTLIKLDNGKTFIKKTGLEKNQLNM